MQHIKHLFTLIFIFLLVSPSQAQHSAGNAPGNRPLPKKQITLTGTITDADKLIPLEFATISVFSLRDSSLLSGGLTDDKGFFEIKTAPIPQYAVVEFISFQKQVVKIPLDRSQLKASKRKIDLGNISLQGAGLELDGVTIRAEKSETYFSLDKRVFNVGKDLANQGGSAEDILNNVPSVTVDIDGVVSLRGSEGVRILVDGKPSGLVSRKGNGLKSIPASLIESVEVITNPSSRYEAEGVAGLINIILKKDKGSGFNGSFDINAGLPWEGGVGANVNYRKGKVNWFANYALKYRTSPGGGYSYQKQTVNDIVRYQRIDQDRQQNSLNNSIRFGIDYLPSDKETLTGAFLYRTSNEDNTVDLVYKDYLNTPENLTAITNRSDDENENDSNLEYSVSYRKQYSSRKHTLSASVQYRDKLSKENSDFFEERTFGVAIDDLIQTSRNNEGEKTWLSKIDFKKPLFDGKGKLELGMRNSFRNVSNDYVVKELINGELLRLPQLSNMFNYDEQVQALYTQLGQEIGNFSYQLGLRAEYTDIRTELEETKERNDRNYFNVFPSAFLNYKLSQINSLQVNYSKRIRRPRFWDLNPFFSFSDSRNTYSGNPDVNPEFTDSYEINFISYWDNLTVSTGLFYRHTRENIVWILDFREDGTTNRQPQNLGTNDDLGLEVTFQYSAIKWLKLDANANLFQNKQDVFGAEGLRNTDYFTWFGRITPRIIMWKGSDLQIRFNYRAPRETVQGSRQAIATLDVGWSLDVMKNTATFNLSVRDIFNSRRHQGTTIGTNFYREAEFRWRLRSVNLAFNYRINQKKKRGRGGSGGSGFGGGQF